MRSTIVVMGFLAAVGCSDRASSPPSPLAAAARADGCRKAELGCPRPIFAVRELDPALAYYRDQLGFRIDWKYGEPPDFASVTRSHTTIFLCHQCQGTPGTGWLWVFARDVDKLHRDLVAKGARVVMPPTDMPWGTREMHVSDRDGNVVRFGGEPGRD